jgi:hypothetical protein
MRQGEPCSDELKLMISALEASASSAGLFRVQMGQGQVESGMVDRGEVCQGEVGSMPCFGRAFCFQALDFR